MKREIIDVRRRGSWQARACSAWRRLRQLGCAPADLPTEVDLTLAPVALGREISPHLIGLSYETRHLIEAALFSPRNADLIGHFRGLSAQGILAALEISLDRVRHLVLGEGDYKIAYGRSTMACCLPVNSSAHALFQRR